MLAPETKHTPQETEVLDIVEAIGRLERSAESVDDFYRRGLALVANHFRAALGVVRIDLPGRHIDGVHGSDSVHTDSWKQIAQTALLKAQLEGSALGEVFQVRSSDQDVGILAVPLHVPGANGNGALALVIGAGSQAVVQAHLSELRAIAGLLDISCPQEHQAPESTAPASPSSVDSAVQGVASAMKAARFKDARELAFALTNGLRAKLDCEQIAMGSVRGQRVRILSISGLDEPKFRSIGTLELQQAMEECLDSSAPIVSQDKGAWADDSNSSGYALHKQWSVSTERSCVASIPMRSDHHCVGVLSLRRPQNRPFTKEEIDSVHQLVAPMGPALELLNRAGRGLVRHGLDAFRDEIREAFSRRRYGRKLLFVGAAALVGWFCVGTMNYETVVQCRLQPHQTLQVSAPFRERVAESQVRAGDTVKKGDLLVRFATDSLELERQQLAAEIEVHQVEVDQAVAAGDWVTASLSRARMTLLETRRASVQRRIDDSSVRAAVDGVILRGDLTHQIGQVMPQGESLFEVAAKLDLHLELEIPERSISDVDQGQLVRFATNARPDAPLEFHIQQVTPAAEVRDAQNVFVAEARGLQGMPGWVRPGMEGVGKVEVGERRVWRVALGKVMDTFYRVWL